MSNMAEYDWSRFLLRINIDSTVENIYGAWATPAGIESWFLRSAVFLTPDNQARQPNEFIQKGDRYTWLWHGYGDEVIEHNDILQANGIDEICFVFAGHCIVSVTIGILADENIVELKQENIPTGEEGKSNIHIGCMEGWTFYLANLKSILEGGIDLRNRNPKLGKVINS